MKNKALKVMQRLMNGDLVSAFERRRDLGSLAGRLGSA